MILSSVWPSTKFLSMVASEEFHTRTTIRRQILQARRSYNRIDDFGSCLDNVKDQKRAFGKLAELAPILHCRRAKRTSEWALATVGAVQPLTRWWIEWERDGVSSVSPTESFWSPPPFYPDGDEAPAADADVDADSVASGCCSRCCPRYIAIHTVFHVFTFLCNPAPRSCCFLLLLPILLSSCL